MKVLIIGLGSMGKRRIRCLQKLNIANIFGVDCREDRRDEAKKKYCISVLPCINEALQSNFFDFAIISLPPKLHVMAMWKCIASRVPFFVEASVVEEGLADAVAEAERTGVFGVPSATLQFHPAINEIFRIVKCGEIGNISNIILHSGQYLPDWHSYEAVNEYYVSDRLTGGAREIVPFELTWLTKLLGFPQRVTGNFRKTINISGAENIDDTYNGLLDYGAFLAVLTVDVVSRHATRRLLINGDRSQIIWSWDEKFIRKYNSTTQEWENIYYETESAETGYNNNITESMYVDEIKSFIDAFKGGGSFPNSFKKDLAVLRLLNILEQSDSESRIVTV